MARAVGHVDATAASAEARLDGSGSVLVGSALSARVGHTVGLAAGGSLSLVAGGNANLTARALTVSVPDDLTVQVGELSTRASAGAELITASSSVRLPRVADVTFVHCRWDVFSSAFDDFENLLPTVVGVTGFLITAQDGTDLAINSGTQGTMELLDVASSNTSTWRSVWTSRRNLKGWLAPSVHRTLGTSMNVGGVRFSAAPRVDPSFIGWGRATLRLAVRAKGGVHVASLGAIDAASAHSVTLAAPRVELVAKDAVELQA